MHGLSFPICSGGIKERSFSFQIFLTELIENASLAYLWGDRARRTRESDFTFSVK